MLVGNIIFGIVSFFLNSYYTGKRLNYTSLQQLRDIAHSYLLAIVIAISIYFLKYIPLTSYIILTLQVAVGVTIFILICEVFKLEEYMELKEIVSQAIKNLKKQITDE